MLQQNYFDFILDERIGQGYSQTKVLIPVAMASISDGAEMLILGLVLPILEKEWELTDFQQSLVVSTLFLTMGLVMLLFGQIPDQIGRKPLFVIGSFILFLGAILSSIAWDFWSFLLFRTILAIGIGMTSMVFSCFSTEFCVTKYRGLAYVILESFFTIGELIVILLAYFYLDSLSSGNWQALIFWTSMPVLLCFISALIFLKESPRFLLMKGRNEESFTILDSMLIDNGKKPLTQEEKDNLLRWVVRVKEYQEVHVAKVSQLFEGDSLWTTLKLMTIWLTMSFIYFGIMFTLPSVMEKLNIQDNNQDISYNEVLFEICVMVLFEFPGYVLSGFLIERSWSGRKNSVSYSLLFTGIICIVIFIFRGQWLTILVGLTKFSITIVYAIIIPFTSELYDTMIRVTASSLNNAVMRFGGVIMPFILIWSFELGPVGPFLCCGILSLISTVAGFTMPRDTAGQYIDQVPTEYQQVKSEQ